MADTVKAIFDAIGRAYKQFILSDIFSFVLPGSLFFLTLLHLGNMTDTLSKLFDKSLVIGCLIWYGIAYIVGFAIQASGHYFHILKYYPQPPKKYDNKEPRYQSHYKEFQDFIEKTSELKYGHYLRAWSEKFILLKQMTGNVAMAIFWSLLFCGINEVLKWMCGTRYCVEQRGLLLIGLGAFAMGVFLIIDHRKLVWYWWDWRRAALDRNRSESPQTKSTDKPTNNT